MGRGGALAGTWWRIGWVDSFRGFDSLFSHHVGTLGKSLTHSCLWRFGVKLRHSIRAVSGALLSRSGLEEVWLNEWIAITLRLFCDLLCIQVELAMPLTLTGDRTKWYWTKWHGQNGSNFYRFQFNWIEFLFSNHKSQISDKPKWV